MHLTVRDVTRFLDVSESTVTRWIRQRGLPAQHVNGQYRFHRAELLEWATANRVKFSLEMLDGLETIEEPPPRLAEALEAGGIFYQVADTSKDRALRALVQVMRLPEEIDRELILRLLLVREAAATTAIGDGIALPHVRNPIVLHVDRPMVTLCFLEHPVDFGALDGKPVEVLFSLVCPTTRSHLQTLSRLSYALQDAQFKAAVMRRSPAEAILAEARRVDAALTPLAGQDGTAP
jgi:PTS system nitrogen regulatory IIA component